METIKTDKEKKEIRPDIKEMYAQLHAACSKKDLTGAIKTRREIAMCEDEETT